VDNEYKINELFIHKKGKYHLVRGEGWKRITPYKEVVVLF